MSNYKNTGMSLKEIKALEADLFSQCESAQAHKRAAENAGHADEAARWDTILQNTWSELKEWQAYTAR